MTNKITIRNAQEDDHPFIFDLSPSLAQVFYKNIGFKPETLHMIKSIEV